jgi:hypothetical protein
MEEEKKLVCILPYINLSKSLIMDDFEILPYDTYDFSKELKKEEKDNLDSYANSFRESLFQKWKPPKKAYGIWILKYKWTIIRTKGNSEDMDDKIKILYLLLKLHINYDFSNPWMNHIHFKTFDIFWCNVKSTYTSKFGSMRDYDNLYSTIPENIGWLRNIIIYPLYYCINDIDVSLKLMGNFEDILGIDKEKIDITYLYKEIIKDSEYYERFLSISMVYYGLEQQTDLFFYFSIIPSIFEVLLYPIEFNEKKKKSCEFWRKLDNLFIDDNDFIDTVMYTKNWQEIKQKIGLIERTIVWIYDLRNSFLHDGKRVFEKLKIQFKWHELKIYDIFQLILQFSILNDFIENWIINDKFISMNITWNIFTTWTIEIKPTNNKLEKIKMDIKLNNLLVKAKNDKKYSLKI